MGIPEHRDAIVVRCRGPRARARGAVGLLLALACVLAAGAVRAQPIRPDEVPPELRPWIPWVLDGLGDDACTRVGDGHVCAWPGELALTASDHGATFVLRVFAERTTRVSLPGSAERWPTDVKEGDDPLVVNDDGAAPYVTVAAGAHEIHGKLAWSELPSELAVPLSVGRVKLELPGAPAVVARRGPDGAVWLGDAGPSAPSTSEPDALELRVMRLVTDGVPLVVTTRLDMTASGRTREIDLGRPLLAGSELLSLEARTASSGRMTEDGRLLVTLTSGKHVFELSERFATPPDELLRAAAPAPWPGEETWSWKKSSARQAELGGAARIDPARTELPKEWQLEQAFTVRPGTPLKIRTVRRGDADPAPNQLALRRVVTIDLDGEGYTVVDSLSGAMHRDFRLDLGAPLERAAVDGIDQLVTLGEKAGTTGVELRKATLGLGALWRRKGLSAPLPVNGWSQDLQSASLELRLPPGWQLLHVSGADQLRGPRLLVLDLGHALLALGLALGLAKLKRYWLALATVVTFALANQVHDAPRAAWVAPVVLALAWAYLPKAWFARPRARTIAWGVSLAALAALGWPLARFGVGELRRGLFPVTAGSELLERELEQREVDEIADDDADRREGGAGTRAKGEEGSMGGKARRGAFGPPEEPPTAAWGRDDSSGSDPLSARGNMWGEPEPLAAKTPGAEGGEEIVQTGDGVPSWHWASAEATWAGPITSDQQFRIWLLSPRLGALLGFARVGFALALGLLFGRLLLRSPALRRPAPPADDGDEPHDEDDSGPTGGQAETVGGDEDSEGDEDAGAESGPGAARKRLLSRVAPRGPARRVVRWLVAGAGVLAALAIGQAAHAQPSQELLDELKARLARPAPCEPACASLPRATLRLRAAELDITAEVHAGADTALRLPGPVGSWVPAMVELDGKATTALTVLGDGHLYLRVKQGVHQLRLRGRVASDALTLALGVVPRLLDLDVQGWSVEGVSEGHAQPSLALHKEQGAEPPPAGEPPGATPSATVAPWLRIERAIFAGPRITVKTHVRRLSQRGAPIAVRYPLWPGEKVTTAAVATEDGAAVIQLAASDEEALFESTLEPPAGEITVTASDALPFSEHWQLWCSPLWRCGHEGLAPTGHMSRDLWAPGFDPWPGEKLSLRFVRPAAAPGRTVTVERALLAVTTSPRGIEAKLSLGIDASTGGVFTIEVPHRGQVRALAVDGHDQPVEAGAETVQVTLHPGAQAVALSWQNAGDEPTLLQVPRFRVGDQAANALVTLAVPANRWLVWAIGGDWGPPTTSWAYAALLLAAAIGLSFLHGSPLRAWQWMLLALGLSQLPPAAAIAAPLWFVAVALRRRVPKGSRALHALSQLGLGVLTLVVAGGLAWSVQQAIAGSPPPLFPRGTYVSEQYLSDRLLAFYSDRTDGTLPAGWALALPIWAWRAAVLAWLGWVAFSLRRWLPDAWKAARQGGLWPAPPPAAATAGAGAATPTAGPPATAAATAGASAATPNADPRATAAATAGASAATPSAGPPATAAATAGAGAATAAADAPVDTDASAPGSTSTQAAPPSIPPPDDPSPG